MSNPQDIEALVETYVRNPGDLTPERLALVERLLSDDPAVRAIRDFFVAFNRELDAVSRTVSPAAEEFADRLFRVEPFILRRMRAHRPSGPAVPAAHTAQPPIRDRHRLLVALGGRSGEPVVRLLEDREERAIRAYVLGLDRLPAVLSIPDIQQAVGIDETGRGMLVRTADVDWNEVTAYVHPSAGRLEFGETREAHVAGVDVRFERSAGMADITFNGKAAFALLSDGSGLRVERLDADPLSIDLPAAVPAWSVWICP